MFLNAQDVVINLDKVSNINIVANKNRIIFNMNYSIQIEDFKAKKYENKDSGLKYISDYVYWDAKSEKEFQENLVSLKSIEQIQYDFIEKPNKDGYININEISSVKFVYDRLRVIFNLGHPVTFKDRHGKEKITSEFVYIDCISNEEFHHFKEYVDIELGI